MEKQIKKTPLHKWHMENKANMVAFGNYEMPLWYESGVKKEHMAVIEEAGLFDTSHMAVLIEEQGRYFTYPYLGEDLQEVDGVGSMSTRTSGSR